MIRNELLHSESSDQMAKFATNIEHLHFQPVHASNDQSKKRRRLSLSVATLLRQSRSNKNVITTSKVDHIGSNKESNRLSSGLTENMSCSHGIETINNNELII